MRNKNLVLSLVVIFTFVSAYYLTFTILNLKIQKEADRIATVGNVIDFNKKQEYLDSIWDKPVKKVLWKNYTYEQIKSRSLNFGLDLQGGTSITIDVDIDEVIRQSCNKKYKKLVTRLIKDIHPDDKLDSKTYVSILKNLIEKEDEKNIFVKCFENKKNGIDINSTDKDVENFLINKIDNSAKKTYEVICSRLDKYGVSQPNIQRLSGDRKIQLEISGAHNQKNIKKLLQGVGELKFYEIYDSNDLDKFIEAANKVISDRDFKDNKGILIKLNSDMRYNKDIIKDVFEVFNKPEIKELMPDNLIICRGSEEFLNRNNKSEEESLFLLKTDENGNEYLNGDVITDAVQSLDDQGRPSIVIRMNAIGKKIWSNLTAKNIGKIIAATFDGKVIMAANVMYKITDGITQITGNYSNEEAVNLATTLKTGSLPVPIHIVNEVIVGPTLSTSVQKQGLKSILYAIVIIFLFMVVFYSSSGLISNIALIFNFLFILGILAQIGAVLTLPGIAGLILTLGMAIDANIIIDERIKEELSSGVNIRRAIKTGYKTSLSSIIDSNLTTLLTGVVLYIFGSGPIKGFSITLIIGLICSFFTSVVFTKYIYYRKEQSKSLKNIKFSWFNVNKQNDRIFEFTKIRGLSYLLSLSVMIIGFILLHKNGGFKYGIEFTGGNSFIVRVNDNVDCTDLGKKLENYFNRDVSVKLYSGNNLLNIITKFSETDSNLINKKMSEAISNVSDFVDINDSSKSDKKTFEIISNESVESTMASDIKKNSIKAILLVLMIMFLYIMFRFNSWKYGLAALISLLHDILMVFAIYGIAKNFGYSIDINQIFIASILTVLGYSINNTVIIFDRLREIMKSGIDNVTSNINAATSKTLGRTLMTSFSTIAVVLILFLFGGIGLHNFSFILLSGFIIGTYSSIFIAGSLLRDLRLKK